MQTQRASFHILRVGLAITFLWIGLLILREPAEWTWYLQEWVTNILPLNFAQVMVGIGVLDIVIGLFLLTDTYVWVAGAVGALHMILVLIVSGITDVTVRDIAIFAGMLALVFDAIPWREIKNKYLKKI